MTPEWRVFARIGGLSERVKKLEARVSALESLLTPEQVAQLDLVRKAERIIDIARAEGQLPPIQEQPPL